MATMYETGGKDRQKQCPHKIKSKITRNKLTYNSIYKDLIAVVWMVVDLNSTIFSHIQVLYAYLHIRTHHNWVVQPYSKIVIK